MSKCKIKNIKDPGLVILRPHCLSRRENNSLFRDENLFCIEAKGNFGGGFCNNLNSPNTLMLRNIAEGYTDYYVFTVASNVIPADKKVFVKSDSKKEYYFESFKPTSGSTFGSFQIPSNMPYLGGWSSGEMAEAQKREQEMAEAMAMRQFEARQKFPYVECPECFPKDRPQNGTVKRVNPDCLACGGKGMVLKSHTPNEGAP